MPKLVLFAAALFSRAAGRRASTAAEAHARITRSRAATRRQRAFDPHEAWVDLGPLSTIRRH